MPCQLEATEKEIEGIFSSLDECVICKLMENGISFPKRQRWIWIYRICGFREVDYLDWGIQKVQICP